jgi:thioredoxin reductase
MTHDVGVIGAGPAGIAAAVQLSRHGLAPVIVERGEIGGLLRTAWWVENLPGFPGGIFGPDLARLLAEQLSASEANLVRGEALSLDRKDGLLLCETDTGALAFRAVIVASGTRPRPVNDIDIAPDAEKRVAREVGELWGLEGRHVAIVGGGDAALDYAIGLSEKNDVTILIRGSRFRALPLLEERAKASERVAIRTETMVVRVAAGSSDDLRLTVQSEGDGRPAGAAAPDGLSADHLVIAIGREPDDGFLSEELRRSEEELRARGGLMFAGDVRSGIFRQVSVAAGQGTHAAMKVAHMLRGWA